MDLSSISQDVLAGLANLRQYFGIPQDWQPATSIGQFVKGSQGPQMDLAAAFMGPGTRLVPAVRFNDRVFTGLNHGLAYEQGETALGINKNPNLSNAERLQGIAVKDGFVTPSGEFLDRQQAAQMMQHNYHMLASEDLAVPPQQAPYLSK